MKLLSLLKPKPIITCLFFSTSTNLLSHLTSCLHTANPHPLPRLHAAAVVSGLAPTDPLVAARLVSLYALRGDVATARAVFVCSSSSPPNAILLTAMARAYASHGRHQEAIHLLCNDGNGNGSIARPGSHAFSCALKCCAALPDLGQGKKLHGRALVCGLCLDVFVCNALISMYAKCGSLEDGLRVFDEMPHRDAVSWNSVVLAFAANGFGLDAVEKARRMVGSGLRVSEVMVITLLTHCAGFVDVREIHGYVCRMGTVCSSTVLNCLVSAYGKCGDVDVARRVFLGAARKDWVTWNAMISCYAQNGLFEESMRLLRDMKLSGFDVNVITYSGIISSLSQNNLFDDAMVVFKELVSTRLKPDVVGIASVLPAVSSSLSCGYCKEIHAYSFRHNLESDRRVQNALVAVYGKYGAVQCAEQIFAVIQDRDVISWSSMIACYVQNEYFVEALNAFRQMMRARILPNPITITSVLSACAGVSGLRLGKEIHLWAIKNKFEDQSFVGSALVDMYAKCGRITESRMVFDQIDDKNLVTYNVMIGAYSLHGQGEDALEIFRMLEEPDHFSFMAALSACSHCGLVEQGIYIFNSMKNFGVTPREGHYACIVDILSRAGRLQQALDLISTMPMKPSTELWGVLLGACKMHNNLGIGVYTGEQIIKAQSSNSGYYVLLSNMMANLERWEGVEEMRKLMKDKGVNKVVGCSWIELESGVHSFFAKGRADDPDWDGLFSILNVLGEQMKEVII